MRRSLRPVLKAVLPRPVTSVLRGVDTYRKRLMMWAQIFREMDGVSDEDRRVLRRSARAAPIRALRNLSRWQNPVLVADAAVAVHGLGRFQVRGRSDDLFHVLPSREPEVFAAIHENLRPGDTFIDAGANVGIYSVLAGRRVGPDGHVLAIEMMPDTAGALRKHLEINGIHCARVVENALSERSGEKIKASYVPGHFGRASVVPSSHGGLQRFEVETRALDDLTADLGEIALMKMDLEGAELAALMGATQTLARTRVVIFEQHKGVSGPTEFLEQLGFEMVDLGRRDRIATRKI